MIIFSVIGIYFTVDDAKKNEMKSDREVKGKTNIIKRKETPKDQEKEKEKKFQPRKNDNDRCEKPISQNRSFFSLTEEKQRSFSEYGKLWNSI